MHTGVRARVFDIHIDTKSETGVIGLRSAETRLRLMHLARYHPGVSSLGRDSQHGEGAHCDEHQCHIGWDSLARKILSSVHGSNGLPSL